MFGIFGFGVLLGMQHALEADHVAAVSSIAARRTRVSDIVKHGLTWGFGHTLTLFLFAGAAILLGRVISETVARSLETAVGAMLIALGAHLLWRLALDRAPALRRDTIRDPDRHEGFRWRTLLVGLMHGMAGSAALLMLTASQVGGALAGTLYIVLFGIGSMLGMGALSVVIAWPLAASARWLTSAYRALQIAVGVITVAIGAVTIWETIRA